LRDRTKDFALRIVGAFTALPKTGEAHVLGKQMLRSGTSIGANYAEAHRSRSKAEFIAKCGDCLREIEETRYWLELLGDAEIVRRKNYRLSGRNATRSSSFLLFHSYFLL